MIETNTVELRYRIWDHYGCRIEVGDDADGIGMLEIVSIESDDKRHQYVYIREEDAEATANAIIKVAEHIRSRKNK